MTLGAKFLLEPVRCPDGFYAYAMALPGGLSKLPGEVLSRCIASLSHAAATVSMGPPTLWLDSENLHKDGGSKLVGANARRWSPVMGFCFDPAGRPPRNLQLSDLMDMDYGTMPQLDDRTAVHIANLQETANAYSALAGRGLSVLLFFGPAASPGATEAAVAAYMRDTQATMRPLMAPGQFQNFQFYLPLLTVAGIAGSNNEHLSRMLGSAELYLRESGDQLLLISRRPLEPLFEAAGLRRAQPIESGAWAFPEELIPAAPPAGGA